MPQTATSPLPEAELLTIRAWIAQGALSDVDAGASDGGTSPGDASGD